MQKFWGGVVYAQHSDDVSILGRVLMGSATFEGQRTHWKMSGDSFLIANCPFSVGAAHSWCIVGIFGFLLSVFLA